MILDLSEWTTFIAFLLAFGSSWLEFQVAVRRWSFHGVAAS